MLIQATHMFRRAGKGFYFKLPSMRMAALDSTGIELSNELSNVKIDRNLAEIERSNEACLLKWRRSTPLAVFLLSHEIAVVDKLSSSAMASDL